MDAPKKGTQTGRQVMHRYDADIPASIYVNGTQIPPIDTNGRITNLSSNTLQFECADKIPIPSRGVVRFTINGEEANLEIPVDVISRVDCSSGFFSWTSQPRFSLQLSIRENHSDICKKYQSMMNNMLLGSLRLDD